MLVSGLTLLSAMAAFPLAAGQLDQRFAGLGRIAPHHNNVKRDSMSSVVVFMDPVIQVPRVSISVGTPPQTIAVALNSWTPSLAIFDHVIGDEVAVGQGMVAPPFYYSNQSSTFSTDRTLTGIRSYVANETIVIGGQSTTQMTFTADYNNLGAWGYFYLGGSLGMGPSGETGTKSLLETLSSKWEEPVSGLYLGQMSANKGEYAFDDLKSVMSSFPMGELTLGGVNKSLYTGEIAYFDAVNTSFWSAPLDAIKIGDETIQPKFTDGTKLNMIPFFGMGGPLTTLPQSAVEALYAKVPGAQLRQEDSCAGVPGNCTGPMLSIYEVPCNTTMDLTFTFGGIDVTASAEDWVSPMTFLDNDTNQTISTCMGVVGSSNYTNDLPESDAKYNEFYLSPTMLSNIYMAFRYGDKPQLGFAKVAPGLPVVDSDCLFATYGAKPQNGNLTDFTNCTYDPDATGAPLVASTAAPTAADDKSKDKASTATGLTTGPAATFAAVLLAILTGSSLL